MDIYDSVVVGAGIVGSAAAYYLAKSGQKKVVLLEQFARNHSRGSSHGHSRITRIAYKKPFYVPMMKDAFQLWSDLERCAGATLFKQTGYLVFGDSTEPYIQSTMASLKDNGIAHKIFSGSEANKKYSRQLKLPPTDQCLYEEVGGMLYAQRALLAFQQEFTKLGGSILEHHKVVEIIPGERVQVVTSKGSITAMNVVIAAGGWTAGLCSSIGVDLPFKVKRVETLYWKVEDPEAFSSDVFPTIFGFANGIGIYGIPVEEYPGMVKISSSEGLATDAENWDDKSSPVTVHKVADFIRSTFKGVATTPSIVEYCMYTESPDYDPVIDRHPQHKNIIIAAGFTGHGFKLSPVVGKITAELVKEEKTSHDISPFKVSRFTANSD